MNGKHRLPPPPDSLAWWRTWLAEVPRLSFVIFRKILVFGLAMLSAFVILLLVFLPLGLLVWWIMRYAAGQ